MRVKNIENDIKGVVFDMDGLLVNSEELYWKANIQAAHEYNLGIPDDSYLKLVGASASEMAAFYHKYFNTVEERDNFIKRTDDLVWQWSNEGRLKLQKGVKQALDLFAEKGLKMAIASSNYPNFVKQFITVTGIARYFDFYLTSDDVQKNQLKSKPAPDIYLLAQEKLGILKENILVFEDSSTGIKAAYSAGLNCIMVPDLKPANEEDRKEAEIYSDFTQFIKENC